MTTTKLTKVRKVEPIYKSKKTTERNEEERRLFLQEHYLIRNPYRTSNPHTRSVLQYERPLEKLQRSTLIVKC